jgi:serine/threonine protein kinase
MVTEAELSGRRYRILEVVGRGGFGTVYRAEMIGAGGFTKQVAIKVLHDEADTPPEMLGRLRDEARILGLLRHRAIVGVDGLALFDQGWAVIMEYVPGVDLASVIAGGPVPPRVALELIEEVASALHAAWDVPPDSLLEPLRLVHRDIKPSNVRVTAQGEVKVLDFGVARADFSAREAHTSNYLFGSLKYMAIERLEGIETPAADVYALGLVLAELLLGRDLPEPPRQAERFERYMDALLEEVVAAVHADPFSTAEGPSAGLLELLRGMLADNHTQRPTAAAVEHACRTLRYACDGPWLREWAALEVPRLATEQTVVERSANSGSVLVERTSPMLEPRTSSTEPDDPRQGALLPRVVLGGVAGGAVLGLLALAGVLWLLKDDPLGVPDLHQAEAPASAEDGAGQGPTLSRLAPEPEVEPAPVEPALAPVQPAPVPVRPAPAPVQPAPAPAPEPAVPTPAPAVPMAQVGATGDARSIWLVSDQERYPLGPVPPGTYEIKAWFDQPEPAVAGSVTLHDGERVTLRCTGAMARCVRAD